MPKSSTTTGGSLANARVNMFFAKNLLPVVFGQCSALMWTLREVLPKNSRTTKLAIPGIRKLSDYDTMPTPLYDEEAGISDVEPDGKEITNFKVTASLKKLGDKFVVPKDDLDTESTSLPEHVKNNLAMPIVGDIMKTRWDAYSGLPAAYRVFGGASATNITAKLTVANLISAKKRIMAGKGTYITQVVLPSQNYATLAKGPSLHLTIHPDQEVDLIADVIATTGYSWLPWHRFSSKGDGRIAPNHIGAIPELNIDVFTDDFIRRDLTTNTATTAGMVTNGGANVIYKSVLESSDNLCGVSFGKEYSVKARSAVGKAQTISEYRGIEMGYLPPVRSEQRTLSPRGTFWYEIWCAFALLFQEEKDGTQKYRAVELYNTAGDPTA